MNSLAVRVRSKFILPLVLASLTPATHAADTASLQASWISAISNDNVDALRTILGEATQDETAASGPLWNVTAGNGKNALMVASKLGDTALADSLVELGVDIKARTQTHGTAFMFAVLGDQQPLAAWLLDLGADINAQGSNGWTGVMIASAKGLDSTLDWLLQQGADANIADVYGFSPLMRAVDNGHENAVRLLLGDGDANVHWQDEIDNSALHYAVSGAHAGIAQQLLQAGASPDVKNRNQLTPLDLARNALDKTGIGSAQLERQRAILALLEYTPGETD